MWVRESKWIFLPFYFLPIIFSKSHRLSDQIERQFAPHRKCFNDFEGGRGAKEGARWWVNKTQRWDYSMTHLILFFRKKRDEITFTLIITLLKTRLNSMRCFYFFREFQMPSNRFYASAISYFCLLLNNKFGIRWKNYHTKSISIFFYLRLCLSLTVSVR